LPTAHDWALESPPREQIIVRQL